MKKNLILYYSKSGNNKFIAEKLSNAVEADIEAIIPKIGNFFLLLLFSWLKINAGIKPISSNIENYQKVIILGPIWIGSLIAPIRGFVKKYHNKINEIVFITVCVSSSEEKESKFGYERVFDELKKILPSKEISCFEISTKLLNKDSNSQSDQFPLITEENFNGLIKSRFDEIVQILKYKGDYKNDSKS